MKAYVFQAALLCEFCAKATCDQLRESVKALHPDFDESNEYTFDSDYFPKGPYADGGGVADTPQHCDHCGVFLENPLTPDGDTYVRTLAEQETCREVDDSWEDVADRADKAGRPALAEWIRFYFAPGQ